VPRSVLKLDRRWMSTPCAAASSTERGCSTPAPASAISSISSWRSSWIRLAFGTTLGSAVNTAGTSVKISHSDTPSAAATATAEASEPPRPSVVTAPSGEIPWKPVTSAIAPSFSASTIRSGRTSRSRALPCVSSVRMPAWPPVKDMAREPSSCTAIEASAQEICSPTESRASSSRICGRADIW